MRKPSAAGGAWSGQPLKKSPKRRTHDHLHRRKRNKPTAASRANLVAARRDSRSAVQLQLGHPLGGSRDHVLQLLFPAVRGQREKCAGGRLHAGPAPPHFRTLLIIWDRLSAHRSKITRNFIAEQGERLWVEYLPGYAPELNPVEYIWAYWKQHALPNVCPKDYWSLDETARKALKRMRRRPRLITAFWQQSDLSF